MTSPRLEDLAASFRRHLRASGRAERTITLYLQSLKFFMQWLTVHNRQSTLDELNKYSISAWLSDLQEVNEPSTVKVRYRGLVRFGRWLVAEGETDKPPTDGVEPPRATQKDVRVLTDDECLRLLKACQRPRGRAGRFSRPIFDGRRDEVMLRLLLDCGFRVSELTNMKLQDVDLDQEVAYVIGKGNRPRAVPFSAKTGQAVDRYLRIRSSHPKALGCDRFLLAERGPISSDGVRWRLEVLGELAKVEGLHPHALRHTFAHRWLASGGQERDLMHLAGWRSDAMLQVYARTTAVERAHQAHRRMRLNDSF